MDRFVLFQKDWGIYLGNAMGLGFWTLLDSVGQDAACTFETEEHAHAHVATWDSKPPDDYRVVKVVTKDKRFATIEECVAAGLPAWTP